MWLCASNTFEIFLLIYFVLAYRSWLTLAQYFLRPIEALKAIPGVGAKSAEAFYKAGFKTPKSIKSAKDEDLLAVPGVGIKLVKKLKNLK